MLSILSNKGRGTITVLDKIISLGNGHCTVTMYMHLSCHSSSDRARTTLKGGTATSNGRSTSVTLSHPLEALSHLRHCTLLPAPAEPVFQGLHPELQSAQAACAWTEAMRNHRGFSEGAAGVGQLQ